MGIQNWEQAFLQKDIGDSILHHMDVETALGCRLVCRSWQQVINNNSKLWARVQFREENQKHKERPSYPECSRFKKICILFKMIVNPYQFGLLRFTQINPMDILFAT